MTRADIFLFFFSSSWWDLGLQREREYVLVYDFGEIWDLGLVIIPQIPDSVSFFGRWQYALYLKQPCLPQAVRRPSSFCAHAADHPSR